MVGDDKAPPAFLFPGQGAQFVGMAVDLVERYPEIEELFRHASDLVGRDLLRLIRQGPEEELSRTDVSQVVIFLHSMGVLHALRERFGGRPPASFTCGLSLGEYSALVFAGSLDVREALEVVAHRGKFMQEAAEQSPGAMTSVIGLNLERVREILLEALKASGDGEALAVANWNSPVQIVVSGTHKALERFEQIAGRAGARRLVRLKVAGAFHSPLMSPAAERLAPHLERLTIRPPRVPFIPNRIGTVVSDPEAIRRCLAEQVTGSVLWTPTMEALAASGVTRAVEVGPGRVLAGLARRAAPSLQVFSLGTCKDVEAWEGPHSEL